jgi:hypothetical protein
LKGHGFSRAALHAIVTPAFSRRGMLFGLRNLPPGAKAQNFSDEFTARLKSCPFKTRFSRMQNLHAIALDLNGKSAPPPDNETVWRELTRLVDIQLCVCIGTEIVDN